jgi:hypothetical protein
LETAESLLKWNLLIVYWFYKWHSEHHNQCRSKLDNWGGGGLIFTYSCSALLFFFEIDCFMVCEHENMNKSPLPPPIIELATRGANEGGGCGGCDTPPIFKHSVLMVIIKSVRWNQAWNQIKSPFYARSKGRDGRLWLYHPFLWNITVIIVRQNISK